MNCWNAGHKPIEHLEHKIAVCDLETKQQKTARSTSLFQPATTNPMKQSMAGGWFGWMVGWSMYTTNIHQPWRLFNYPWLVQHTNGTSIICKYDHMCISYPNKKVSISYGQLCCWLNWRNTTSVTCSNWPCDTQQWCPASIQFLRHHPTCSFHFFLGRLFGINGCAPSNHATMTTRIVFDSFTFGILIHHHFLLFSSGGIHTHNMNTT